MEDSIQTKPIYKGNIKKNNKNTSAYKNSLPKMKQKEMDAQ